MKKSYLVALTITLLLGLSSIGLSSCADKMTDRNSAMKGGDQGPMPPPGVHDYLHNGTPANTDGAGRPLAGGKINTTPDTMWNQNSPFEGKAF